MKHTAWNIILSKLTVIFIVGSVLSSVSLLDVSAQRRGRNYNNFDHSTAAHRKQSCNECHKLPTGVSSAETADGEKYNYPDITDYPDHDSCLDCHRQQFFKGAKPAICSICHTKVSPRDKVRFAFPKANQAEEFNIRFPHDVHQDIIANLKTPSPRVTNIAAAHFVNARFTFAAGRQDEKKTDYNNCTICHAPKAAKNYIVEPRRPQMTMLETGLTAASHTEKIAASVGYFKDVPNGHNSCFNCHYSEQKPTHNDCAGCHIPSRKPTAESSVIERYTLKFNHNQIKEGGTNPHDTECTSCHLRITQSADLRSLSPDVPVFTCGGSCHGEKIKMEISRREDDLAEKQKNPQYQITSCSYCHTSFIGSFQVPESHKTVK